MNWRKTWRADPRAAAIADRHYNRQSVGSDQFMPPGRCMVLLAEDRDLREAVWGTSWPFPEHVKHQWAGAWMCSIFRNETRWRASGLIREAVAATRFYFGDPPAQGMVTFVDERHVREKQDPGHTFIIAGFRPVGRTVDQNLIALQMTPDRMPAAAPAMGMSFALAL